MNNDINDLSNVGNFTKFAVKSFEKGIVNEANFLQKVNKNKLGEEYTFMEDRHE